ncbi:MAG: hypothetical protein R3F60_09700 [bacterium]
MSALLALLLLSPAGLASPKEDPRVRIEATRDADTVIFTIHLAPDATEVRVQVYGTDGLVVHPQPLDLTTVRATFTQPPAGASVVAQVTARFPDGPGEGLVSVRVGPKPALTGRATTVGGRRGRLRPPGG